MHFFRVFVYCLLHGPCSRCAAYVACSLLQHIGYREIVQRANDKDWFLEMSQTLTTRSSLAALPVRQLMIKGISNQGPEGVHLAVLLLLHLHNLEKS